MTCYVAYSVTPTGVCVQVFGELDLSVSEILSRILRRVVDLTVGTVEVNLREATFLDCTGLAALLHAREHARQHARVLHISQPRGIVLWVLGLTETLTVLTTGAPSQAPAPGVSPIG